MCPTFRLEPSRRTLRANASYNLTTLVPTPGRACLAAHSRGFFGARGRAAAQRFSTVPAANVKRARRRGLVCRSTVIGVARRIALQRFIDWPRLPDAATPGRSSSSPSPRRCWSWPKNPRGQGMLLARAATSGASTAWSSVRGRAAEGIVLTRLAEQVALLERRIGYLYRCYQHSC